MKGRFLAGLKLKHKLMFSFLLLIIIPLGIFTLISFANMRLIMEERILFSASHSFEQTADFIAYKVGKIIQLSDVIALDITVNDMLEKDLETYTLPEQYKDMNSLRRQLDAYFDRDDGIQVRIFVRDEVVYSRDSITLLGFSDAARQGWFTKLEQTPNRVLMCPAAYLGDGTDTQVLSLARRLRRSNDYQVTLAYLRIDFNAERIREILEDANVSMGSLTYLQNSEDVLVAATDEILLGTLMIDPALREVLLDKPEWEPIATGQGTAFVKARSIPNSDWTMVTVIPSQEIFSQINLQRSVMLILLAIISAAAYIVSLFVSHMSTKRIARLAHQIRIVHSGDFTDAIIPVDSLDEIGELTQDYNFMISRIIELMGEQRRAGMEIKNAELRALQAQINPHFLYNTLDLINWMSYEERGEDIRTLVNSLSEFYKLSLNRGRDFLSIHDELAHVRFYMRIQNIRLNDRIALNIDVSDEIGAFGILKLTLQPIVENAIVHGIMNTEEKRGTIGISGRLDAGTVELLVQDDGCGIEAERLRSIFAQGFEGQQNSGFGIRNIHERLRLVYGAQYGLSIQSEHGRNTRVCIRFPAHALEGPAAE